MLPASERLRKTSVFQRAYSARNSVNSGCVTLYVLLKRNKDQFKKPVSINTKNQEKHPATCRPDIQAGSSAMKIDPQPKQGWPQKTFPLVGFSISKKVLKSACKRNRAKRRVREAYREIRRAADPDLIAQVKMERFYSLVFVINPSVLNAKFDDVSAAVRDSLIKATKKFSHKS